MNSKKHFYTAKPDFFRDLESNVAGALAEDIGSGDINAALVPANRMALAKIIARESGVICGRPWVDEVFRQLDPGVTLLWHVDEGQSIDENQLLVSLEGPARALLSGERTALNFLQTLSATASESRKMSDFVAGLGIALLDTRKTLPGLRLAQKYAVRVGGCANHRTGLYDGFLIKENHIAACGSIAKAVSAARLLAGHIAVEVETENLQQVEEALAAGADRIMLDEFSIPDARRAIDLIAGRCEVEISGGVSMEQLRTQDLSGVDFLSMGSLTKHVRALDLSMRVELN